MKLKKTFALHLDCWDWFKLLTDEELGQLLRAIFQYEREGVEPCYLDDKIKIVFYMVKENLDRDRKRYEAVCSRNKENAKVRWERIQSAQQSNT